MRFRASYHFYAAFGVAVWSLAYVFTRVALASFSPFSLGFLRYAFASAALIVALAVTKTGWPRREALWPLAVSGAVGFFLYMILFNLGSRTVPSAPSCTVVSTAPLITMLLARAVYKEKLPAVQYIAALLSFLGVLVLTVWNIKVTADPGLLYIFAGAILLSIYSLMQRKLTKLCTPLQSTAYGIFFGTLMLGIFAPAAVRELPAASPAAIGCVAVLGIFCGALSYCCWNKALSMADNAASVTNYMFAEPFLAALFGLLIAGEKLAPSTIVGGCIIIAGMALFYFGKRSAGKTPEQTDGLT